MGLPPHHRHGRAKVLATPRRRTRAHDRGLLAHGHYDQVGICPKNNWTEYDWVKKCYDTKKNRHHNGIARKLTYRRFTKLKRMYRLH